MYICLHGNTWLVTLWLNGPLGVVAGGVPAVQLSALLPGGHCTCHLGGRRGTVSAPQLRLVAAEELV